jgi:hypothetical protein
MTTEAARTVGASAPGTSEAASERSAAYERARDACDEAMAIAGAELVERTFIFAGRRVRMRVGGRELAEHLMRPFVHLRDASGRGAGANGGAHEPASLAIDVWDERVVHVPYPSGDDREPNETMRPTGHGVLALSAATRFVRYDCTAWVTWLDRGARRIIGWRANADRLSMHERTRPLPFLLPVWYADQGVQVIHAGLVARDGRGILFCGANGAGKSTSSLACLCAGLDFLSDDHVGLESTTGGFLGHSVFASTRLEPDHLQRFPELVPHAIPSPEWYETKSLILVAEAFPERVKPLVPISAIALPVLGETSRSSITPIGRAAALRALAPSTLMQMPFGATADRFAELARLTASVPAFRLDLGRDVRGIAPRVHELLDELA